MKKIFNIFIISIILVSFIGCTSDFNETLKAKLEKKKIVPKVTNMIDRALEENQVIETIKDDLVVSRDINLNEINGKSIVDNLLKTEKGKDFIYYAYSTSNYRTVDDVLEKARPLLTNEQMSELEKEVKESKKAIIDSNKAIYRKIPASQKQAFLKDLQQLIVVSVVLLAAGIVYACLPTTVLWGKITAACAISVAAGMVALTVMSLYRYFSNEDPNKDSAIAFEQWLNDVTKEPAAAYALATGIIAMGTSLQRSPIVTGLILIVFALFKVMEMVKPMLKKYNFRM